MFRTLDAEWSILGSTTDAAAKLREWAQREPALGEFATPADVVVRCQARGDVEGSNRLLGALLRVAADDRTAGRAVLQAVLPALVGLTHRLPFGAWTPWPDSDQLDQETVAIAWEQVARLGGTSPRWPAMTVVNATWERLRTVRAQHLRRSQSLVDLTEAAAAAVPTAEPSPADQLMAILAEAVRRGALDEPSATLIFRTRVAGDTPAEVAAQSGRHAKAVYKQRDRAEQALASFASGLAAAS